MVSWKIILEHPVFDPTIFNEMNGWEIWKIVIKNEWTHPWRTFMVMIVTFEKRNTSDVYDAALISIAISYTSYVLKQNIVQFFLPLNLY